MLHWLMTRGCRNRLFEWVAAIIMTWLALRLMGNPARINHSTFKVITVLMSPTTFVIVLLVVGALRAAVLAIDGYFLTHWTPHWRSLGALCAALIWGQMGLALEIYDHSGQGVTIGSPLYFGLMFGELFSCYRPLARDVDNGPA